MHAQAVRNFSIYRGTTISNSESFYVDKVINQARKTFEQQIKDIEFDLAPHIYYLLSRRPPAIE